jgi:hypothetical protein
MPTFSTTVSQINIKGRGAVGVADAWKFSKNLKHFHVADSEIYRNFVYYQCNR